MNLPEKKADGSGRFYEYVIENIRQMIANGELQAGQKLPSERELAEKFNVSRVPIREALKILEYMGVLDSSPGDGTYLKNISVESLINKMNFSFVATADTLRDLLELRIVLETFAAYHAAQRRTDEDISSIRLLLTEMREAKKALPMNDETIQRLRSLSQGFHRAVVHATHNVVLYSVYENLYELLDISRQFTISTSGISYSSILAHEALFNKIIEQDAEGARQCMEEHMQDVRDNLNATMQIEIPKVHNELSNEV